MGPGFIASRLHHRELRRAGERHRSQHIMGSDRYGVAHALSSRRPPRWTCSSAVWAAASNCYTTLPSSPAITIMGSDRYGVAHALLHEGHRDGLARHVYGQRPAIATLRFRHHRLRPSNAVSSPSAQNHEHRVLHICPPRPPLSRPPPGSSSASFSSGQSTTSWLIVGICLRRPAGSSSSQPPFVGVKLREGIHPDPSHPSGTSSAAHVRLCGSNQDDLSDQQLNSDLNDQQLVSAAHVRLCESNQFGHGQSAPTSAAVLSPQFPCALQPNEDINTCVYPTIACSLAGVGLARCEAGAVSCPHHA